jgi:hypothetical protein
MFRGRALDQERARLPGFEIEQVRRHASLLGGNRQDERIDVRPPDRPCIGKGSAGIFEDVEAPLRSLAVGFNERRALVPTGSPPRSFCLKSRAPAQPLPCETGLISPEKLRVRSSVPPVGQSGWRKTHARRQAPAPASAPLTRG